jgi:putative nucleotide binding protein
MQQQQQNRYEEYAYVLAYEPRGKSKRVRGREGFIVQAIGERYLTLLELLGIPNISVEVGERVYIGREGRTKILSVLGKLEYDELSTFAKDALPEVIELIVKNNEKRFIEFINTAGPINPRIHKLELIPGIGKVITMNIIREREVKPFESYDDLYKRTGLKDAYKLISKRILQEITGSERINIFVKKIQ